MTRSITTAAELDALPEEGVLLEASGRYRYQRGTFEQCWVRLVPPSITGATDRVWEVLVHGSGIPHSLVHTEDLYLPVTVLHDPSAPVVPVVSDAAVKVVADEVKAHSGPLGDPDEGTLCGCGAVVAPVGEYGVRAWREHVAGAVLAAAVPHLGAAPSATREDVLDVVWRASLLDEDQSGAVADALLARFTITPRTDR